MHLLWACALQLQCCKLEGVTLFSLHPGASQLWGYFLLSKEFQVSGGLAAAINLKTK